jgi:uncharacterized protein (DUF2237 family)
MTGEGGMCISDVMSPAQLNVLSKPLVPCSMDPLTGFYRDGCCSTGVDDVGRHTVCAQLTESFLQFSKARGNDLVTPFPAYGFPGLKAGDRWCLCSERWLEAVTAGVAPPVVLQSTNAKFLRNIDLATLLKHALDPV